jgi:hypothetical protein
MKLSKLAVSVLGVMALTSLPAIACAEESARVYVATERAVVTSTSRLFVVSDDFFRAVAGLPVLGSLLTTDEHHSTRTLRATRGAVPSIRLVPVELGSGAYGLVAVGEW